MKTKEKETYKIVSLQIDNVMRISTAFIKPDGNLFIIGGDNDQGKTTALQCIAMAIKGADEVPIEPIMQGKDKAQIILDIDKFVVTRTFTEASGRAGYLTVKTKDGATYSSPQKLLSDLYRGLSFDPLAFTRMDTKSQEAELKKLVGLNFAQADMERKTIYEKRTLANRDLSTAKGAVTEAKHYPDAPDVEQSVSGLSDELEACQAHNRGNDQARQELDDASDAIATAEDDCVVANSHGETCLEEVRQAQHKLKTARRQVEMANEAVTQAKASHKSIGEAVDKLVDQDEQSARTKRDSAETINAQVRANAERAKLELKRDAKQVESHALTRKIDQIDLGKANQLRDAEFPIDGLGLGDKGVTFEGIPFAQCSSSKQLRISLAMGLAMNPTLKVVLIRDGSLLDEESLAIIAQMAEEADTQVWMERVDKSERVSIIMEDGKVQGAEEEDRHMERADHDKE